MKLTYRGVSYDYTPNPMPKMGDTAETGVYRGAPVTFQTVAELPAQPVANLSWRGVPYQTGTAVTAPVAVVEPVAAPAAEVGVSGIPELARNLFIRRHQRSRKREQGMMVRLAAEVGLPLDEAIQYESHIQGKRPHDFAAYDRSSTAMS